MKNNFKSSNEAYILAMKKFFALERALSRLRVNDEKAPLLHDRVRKLYVRILREQLQWLKVARVLIQLRDSERGPSTTPRGRH